MTSLLCPLCEAETTEYWQDKRREYRRCDNCQLICVPEKNWLSSDEEKAVYDLHENDSEDQGYRRFLSRLATPLLEILQDNSSGLEFGCGPGPALAEMLKTSGHKVDLYDLYYHPDESVWQRRYDFITATEVVEHLKAPGEELHRLWGILKPSGVLGIMTKKARDLQAFRQWHYKNDLTHIAFFSEATFEYLSQWLNADILHSSADVVIFQKR